MKRKFSLLIALMPLVGLIALAPLTANTQDNANAQNDAQAEFERAWYDICYNKEKKDAEKCYQQSKELVEKFPKSTYVENAKKNIKSHEKSKALERFQAALTAYSNAPDAAKLDQLFAAGDECLKGDKLEPALQQYALGRVALAGASGAMGEVYKNLDKVKGYAENALKAFEPAAPPEGWKKEEWGPLREAMLAQMNQYLGWYFIMGTKSDPDQGLSYLAKAIQVRGKEGVGWKDPHNYWLRSTIYSDQYVELKKPYDAMTDEQKASDAGKEILRKVNELLDTKLIPEYARVLATATNPNAKPIYDAVKPQFDVLWKFRTDAPDKAADYVKNYADDPTIAPTPVPAKSVDASNLNAPAAPTTVPGNVKLQAGGPAIAPGGNGAKTTAEKKVSSKSKKRGKG